MGDVGDNGDNYIKRLGVDHQLNGRIRRWDGKDGQTSSYFSLAK